MGKILQRLTFMSWTKEQTYHQKGECLDSQLTRYNKNNFFSSKFIYFIISIQVLSFAVRTGKSGVMDATFRVNI